MPDEDVTMEDGSTIKIGGLISYQGREGCEDVRCRRMVYPDGTFGECIGWHCAVCHEPTGMYGHVGTCVQR